MAKKERVEDYAILNVRKTTWFQNKFYSIKLYPQGNLFDIQPKNLLINFYGETSFFSPY